MVMDFSAEDKASSVKFCTAVHRSLWQGICHFGELCCPRMFPRSPFWASGGDSGAEAQNGVYAVVQFVCVARTVHWQRIQSACVDKRQSPKMDVRVYLFIHCSNKFINAAV